MESFFNTDIGRGITGIIISIVITLAVLFPIFFMELFSRFIPLG
jgi:hypothetical protein